MLTTWREELVEHDAAVSGELVRSQTRLCPAAHATSCYVSAEIRTDLARTNAPPGPDSARIRKGLDLLQICWPGWETHAGAFFRRHVL